MWFQSTNRILFSPTNRHELLPDQCVLAALTLAHFRCLLLLPENIEYSRISKTPHSHHTLSFAQLYNTSFLLVLIKLAVCKVSKCIDFANRAAEIHLHLIVDVTRFFTMLVLNSIFFPVVIKVTAATPNSVCLCFRSGICLSS